MPFFWRPVRRTSELLNKLCKCIRLPIVRVYSPFDTPAHDFVAFGLQVIFAIARVLFPFPSLPLLFSTAALFLFLSLLLNDNLRRRRQRWCISLVIVRIEHVNWGILSEQLEIIRCQLFPLLRTEDINVSTNQVEGIGRNLAL